MRVRTSGKPRFLAPAWVTDFSATWLEFRWRNWYIYIIASTSNGQIEGKFNSTDVLTATEESAVSLCCQQWLCARVLLERRLQVLSRARHRGGDEAARYGLLSGFFWHLFSVGKGRLHCMPDGRFVLVPSSLGIGCLMKFVRRARRHTSRRLLSKLLLCSA